MQRKQLRNRILSVLLSGTMIFGVPVTTQAETNAAPGTAVTSESTIPDTDTSTEAGVTVVTPTAGESKDAGDQQADSTVTPAATPTAEDEVLDTPAVIVENQTSDSSTFAMKQTPQISVTPEGEKNETYRVALSQYTLPEDAVSLSVGVWNETQGIVRWYDAAYNATTARFEATFDVMDYGVTGKYFAHFYYATNSGAKAYACGGEFTITELPVFHPHLSKSEFTDATEVDYQLELSDYDLKEGAQLLVGTWSDANGQDDMKWIPMNADGSYKYSTTIHIADFKSPGKYYAHTYCKNADGSMSYVVGHSFEVQEMTDATFKVENFSQKAGTADVLIQGLTSPAGITSVKVPMWSAANQSDIHWYEAAKVGNDWHVKVDIADARNLWAVYTVHAYATDGHGFMKFAGGSKLDYSLHADAPVVTVDEDKNTGLVKVNTFDLPDSVTEVSCAIWSAAGGGSDMTWQTLKAGTDGWSKEFQLSLLKHTGKAYAHVYLTRNDGSKVFLGGTTFSISSPSVSKVDITTDNASGDFTVTIKGLSSKMGVKEVQVPVWSQSNQSDIVWYTATKDSAGNYVVKSNISKHKYNIGTYNVHVYVTDKNDVKTNVNCSNMTFKASFDSFSVADDPKETHYTATLSNFAYPGGVSKVEFAAWSEQGGQDDCYWYTASQNGSNYTADIDITKHKTLGKYQVHVYVTTKSGNKVYITGTDKMNVKTAPKATVAVTGRNDGNGAFEVTVSGITAPSGVSQVRIAAWTAANGSDMSWYTCKAQGDGTYKVAVNAAYHQHNVGKYNIHAYITMGNGIQSYAGGTTYNFQPANYMYARSNLGNGIREVVLVNPSSTSNLRFAVWSEIYGQDDLVWYTASRASDGTYRATVNAKNHKSAGLYQVHAYANSTALATGAIIYMNPSEMLKNGWYYENGFKLYYVDGVLQKDVEGILGPQSQYMAKINRTTCTVTIYAKDGDNGFIIPVKAFACSVGLPGTPTDTGTYNTLGKYRWKELMGPSYGQYATRIYEGVYFHSVAGVNMTPYNISAGEYNKLGSPASHGCVRLCVRDAKWIYDNCKLGMTVVIYDSSDPGPLGKPATIKIPASQNWDPTDPSI